MKRVAILILALAILLPCGVALTPSTAKAESMYIIPDSNTRELSYEEIWEYRYDTLLYAFNEILARHGYKFETGSNCYNWFTQMPWYKPNASENSKNHSESYNKTTKLEWTNINKIKEVRRIMRENKDYNNKGKGMPIPPAQNINKPRGFEYVELQANQKFAVYTAPSASAYRANNGKAAVSTNGAIYALGWENGWMLMLYEANAANQYRIGYIEGSKIRGKKPALGQLYWDGYTVDVLETVALTDDPALTGKSLMTLPAGSQVTYLSTMYNTDAWDYVETTLNGQTIRGFVPNGCLSGGGVDMTEEDAMVGDG